MKGFWLAFVMNMLIFVIGVLAGWHGKMMWDHHKMEMKGGRRWDRSFSKR